MYNKHYITANAQGRITDGWSDGIYPDRDTTDAILLRKDGGYQFRLFAGGAENPLLTDDSGVHIAYWDNGAVRAATDAELKTERAALLAAEQPTTKLATLKAKLSTTDYQAIKFSEGWLTDDEYAPTRQQRQTWRNEINVLEAAHI